MLRNINQEITSQGGSSLKIGEKNITVLVNQMGLTYSSLLLNICPVLYCLLHSFIFNDFPPPTSFEDTFEHVKYWKEKKKHDRDFESC